MPLTLTLALSTSFSIAMSPSIDDVHSATMHAPSDLRRRLGDRAGVEGDRRLRHEPARDRCARAQVDHGLTEDDPLEMGGRAEIDTAGDLPEDVLGQPTAGEVDGDGVAHRQDLGDLE